MSPEKEVSSPVRKTYLRRALGQLGIRRAEERTLGEQVAELELLAMQQRQRDEACLGNVRKKQGTPYVTELGLGNRYGGSKVEDVKSEII